MKRIAMLLLVALMVPTLILATPHVAEAATVYGPSVTSDPVVLTGNWRPESDVTCVVVAYYVVASSTSESVKWKVSCSNQWNGDVKGAEMTIDFKGTLRNGGDCDAVDHDTLDDNKKGSGTTSMGILLPGNMCQVGQVCITLFKSTHMWDDNWEESCAGIALGVPPGSEPDQTCTGITVSVPEQYKPSGAGEWPDMADAKTYGMGTSNAIARYTNYRFRITTQSGIGTTTWIPYVIMVPAAGATTLTYNAFRNYPAPPGFPADSGKKGVMFSGTQVLWTPVAAGTSSVDTEVRVRVSNFQDYYNTGIYPAQNWTVLGYGVYKWSDPPGPTDPNATMWVKGQASKPDAAMGINDPSKCRFYWGQKIALTASDTLDEPIGPAMPLDAPGSNGSSTEPTPTDPSPPAATSSCNFSFTDPATWAGGGICALVKLIGEALGVLGSILDGILGIPGAILDGLAGLLIPSDGFLSDKISDLKASWADTAPGQWMTSIGELAPGNMSGCGGLPLDVDLPGGVAVHEHLGEACSGGSASAASLVRIALQAVCIIGGGMACLRALGSGFGWNPQVGKGE